MPLGHTVGCRGCSEGKLGGGHIQGWGLMGSVQTGGRGEQCGTHTGSPASVEGGVCRIPHQGFLWRVECAGSPTQASPWPEAELGSSRRQEQSCKVFLAQECYLSKSSQSLWTLLPGGQGQQLLCHLDFPQQACRLCPSPDPLPGAPSGKK